MTKSIGIPFWGTVRLIDDEATVIKGERLWQALENGPDAERDAARARIEHAAGRPVAIYTARHMVAPIYTPERGWTPRPEYEDARFDSGARASGH